MTDVTKYWRTQDGRMLEIKWMDSQHLAHSLRMLNRTGKTNPWVRDELHARGHYPLDEIPKRETPIQMCWLRALIDTGHSDVLELFYRNPDKYIAMITREDVIAKAMEYRMKR